MAALHSFTHLMRSRAAVCSEAVETPNRKPQDECRWAKAVLANASSWDEVSCEVSRRSHPLSLTERQLEDAMNVSIEFCVQ